MSSSTRSSRQMRNEHLELAAVEGREPPAPLVQNDNGGCLSFVWRQKKLAFCFGLYCIDLATDIMLICEYLKNEEMWYFGLTIICVVFPAVIISVMNGLYYWEKWKVKRQIEQDDKYNLKRKLIVDPCIKFVFRFIACIFLISPVVSYFDICCYGCQQYATRDDEERRELYKKEKKRESERSTFYSFYALFESFIESAPQLLLQIYILATRVSSSNILLVIEIHFLLTLRSVLFSLGSLSFALTAFLRKSKSLILFPFYFFTIGPRVMILAFFAASVNGGKVWFWIVIVIHALLMAIFFRPQKNPHVSAHLSNTKVLTHWARKSVLTVGLIFTQIFTLIPFKRDVNTRTKYARSFYIICGLENIVLLCWWGIGEYATVAISPPNHFWVVCGVVVLGLVFYVAIICFIEKFNKLCNEDAYFAPSKLSMIATHGTILKRAEFDHLLHTKEDLDAEDYSRLEELAQDVQVDLNHKSQEEGHFGRTSLMLLCCPNEHIIMNNGRLLKCAEILVKGRAIDVNLKDDGGSNALTLLCRYYQGDDLNEVIRLLIRHGIDVMTQESTGDKSTALLNLCQYHAGGSLKEALRMIIDHDTQLLTTKNTNRDSALTLILKGQSSRQNRHHTDVFKIVRLILKYGLINAEEKNNNNKDAFDVLFDCCGYREDFIDLFRLLVGSSIYPHPRDGEGTKALLPLCTSAERIRDYYEQFAPLLIELRKVDVNAKTNDDLATPLHLLCKNYNDENLINFVDNLTQNGADKDALDINHATALHLLCEHYHGPNLKEIAKRIESETNVNTKDKFNRTVLHLVCQFTGNDNLTVNLLSRLIGRMKTEILKQVDNNGKNALHYLFSRNTNEENSSTTTAQHVLDIAFLLIQNGDANRRIDANQLDICGKSALHLLCENYHRQNLIDVIRLLVASGIDVRAETQYSSSAVDLLCEHYKGRELFPIIKFLVDQVHNGIVSYQSSFLGFPLNQLLRNYKGDDMLDIVKYFIVEKKIAFDRAKAIEMFDLNVNNLPPTVVEDIRKQLCSTT